MAFTLEALDARVALRASASPEESYTAKLIGRGVNRRGSERPERGVPSGAFVEALLTEITERIDPLSTEPSSAT